METLIYEEARINLTTKTNDIEGICEVLRLTYDLVYEIKDKDLRDKITHQLVIALIMAKKMHERLVYYKTTYNDTTGHNLKNLRKLTDNKIRMRFRKERKPL